MFILIFSSVKVGYVFHILMAYFIHVGISEIGMHLTVDGVIIRFSFL